MPKTTDIFGKKSRSYFHRHNVFFKVTDAIADRIMIPFDRITGKDTKAPGH